MNIQALERAYEWYTSGPRQRLQPGGAIVVVMTRWNMKDLTGMLLKSQKELKSDKGSYRVSSDTISKPVARVLEEKMN